MEKETKKGERSVVDEELKQKADAKIKKDDWIRASMMIEVLAITEEATKSALQKHTDALAKEKQVMAYKQEYSEINKIQNPLPKNPNIKEAFSQVVEIECAVRRYEDLIQIVMHYGPSSIEILEPNKLKITLGEAQGILNSVADLIHKFVAAGIGGLIIRS